ncbi:mitochondrial ubiquitin ligase activator of nfkb 1-A [Chanos chanos]|uniref:RING-type E3 ubiquitin transferase n=1 Tax=Chanos chanos TaxID=29144 RepID=A0A6J2VHU8_CHACN|nr:mitochondrial ubiquitin ligase activator of nfkb 1-A-like [Chanos chanos]XP_030631492.1 mitochondrial ubiquitin ligase activator of nfkb 1-A-like [Chanos chanos]
MSDPSLNSVTFIFAGSSFAFSALFYHLYREKREEICKLKEIPHFQPDHNLLRILKASNHKRLRYVAVEGLVEADDRPLTSQYVPRCYGVVQKITTLERWKIWSAATNSWIPRSKDTKETKHTVPFRLVQPGSYMSGVSVKVQSPLEASGDYLEEVHRSTSYVQDGMVDILVQGLSGEKQVALEVREEMLRTGTTLTGFGELVLEHDGVMRLQAPEDGREYILIPGDYKSLVRRHESSATLWKVMTAACAITGSALLGGLIHSMFSPKDNKRN